MFRLLPAVPFRPFAALEALILFLNYSAQSEYTKAFTHQKPDKKLRWLPQLGSVNLTIELKDRTLELEATPLQASLIELFGIEGELSCCARSEKES